MRACVCWANGGHDETTDRQTGLSLHIPRRRRRQKQSIHPSRSYYLLKRCQSISLSLSPQSLTHSVTHPLYDKSTVCVCGLSLQIESRGKHTHTRIVTLTHYRTCTDWPVHPAKSPAHDMSELNAGEQFNAFLRAPTSCTRLELR